MSLNEVIEKPTLTLYSTGTSNGQKITIFLKLLGVPYNYHRINLSANEQKEPWFIALNPNGRIPVITDTLEDGMVKSFHETSVILQYLADRYDVQRKYSFDHEDPLWWDQLQWLTFQVASHSPMQGQAHHFVSFAKERNEYGIKRYTDEVKRLYNVYELRLKENNGWLVGDGLNIADISAYPWLSRSRLWGNESLSDWPGLARWVEKVNAIPGVEEGQTVE